MLVLEPGWKAPMRHPQWHEVKVEDEVRCCYMGSDFFHWEYTRIMGIEFLEWKQTAVCSLQPCVYPTALGTAWAG